MDYLAYVNGTALGMHFPPILTALFVLAIAWSAVWKGIALWKSARNSHLAWFVVLLVVNTVGILEILYIFFFQHCCKRKNKARKRRTKR